MPALGLLPTRFCRSLHASLYSRTTTQQTHRSLSLPDVACAGLSRLPMCPSKELLFIGVVHTARSYWRRVVQNKMVVIPMMVSMKADLSYNIWQYTGKPKSSFALLVLTRIYATPDLS